MSKFTLTLCWITVGAVLLYMVLISIAEYKFLLPKYITAEGVVLDVEVNIKGGLSRPLVSYYPTIEFKTLENEIITFRKQGPSLWPTSHREKGHVVKIVYNKENPYDASIKFSWVETILFNFLFLLILLIPLGFGLQKHFKRKLSKGS